MPPPMNTNVLNTINDNLHEIDTSLAEHYMLNAAREIPSTEGIDGIKDKVFRKAKYFAR